LQEEIHEKALIPAFFEGSSVNFCQIAGNPDSSVCVELNVADAPWGLIGT
jgi:hypothetical protein